MFHLGLSVDEVLNLIWVAICVSGLGGLSYAEFRRKGARPASGRLRRAAAFLTITLALFPSVSVTDDEASLWFLRQAGTRSGVAVPAEEKDRTEHLGRLFDSINTFQIQSIWALAFSLCFVALIQCAVARRLGGLVFSGSSRAPPSAA